MNEDQTYIQGQFSKLDKTGNYFNLKVSDEEGNKTNFLLVNKEDLLKIEAIITNSSLTKG